MKKIPILSYLIFNAFLFPLYASASSDNQYDPVMMPRIAKPKEPIITLALPQPRTSFRKVDLFASALYWHAMEVVDWCINSTQIGNFQKLDYHTTSFGWDPGFRVGIGYTMEYDRWNTQLYFTRFHTTTSDQTSGTIRPAFFGTQLAILGRFETGKLNGSITFSMLDLDLGCPLFIHRTLSIHPLIGLKGGWIDQTLHCHWQALSRHLVASDHVINNFGGGGPKGGWDGSWIFLRKGRHRFSLKHHFEGAWMWGHWTLQDHFQDNFFVRANIKTKERNFGACMLQSFLGLGWDYAFDKTHYHISAKVGYELQDWFDQYQGFDDFTGQHNNDLFLQGMTFDFRYDF